MMGEFTKVVLLKADGVDEWWLAEVVATTDGPRTRFIGVRSDEAEARRELASRARVLVQRQPDAIYQRGYEAGQRDGLSRAGNRPGDGDMGG